jgi:predicted RNA-binding Zn ribbon-like protein
MALETHDTTEPAPGELWRVQRLVNTLDLEDGTDDLADPLALASWLVSHGLSEAGETFDDEDAARVRSFREALRRLLLSHNGGALDLAAVDALDAAARLSPIVVGFAPDGSPRLSGSGSGASAVLGRVLAIIARADAEGTWARLKICPADECLWAFYDFSRNHSRTWCSMSVCGNRSKARTYRRRSGTEKAHLEGETRGLS